MAKLNENRFCFGCLGTEEEFILHEFINKIIPFRAIKQVDTILLCYLCKRIAQHAELFIQNVQSNQMFLEKFHCDLSTQSVCSQPQPITLARALLPSIQLTGTGDEESCSIISHLVNKELKEEKVYDDSDDYQDSVKDEDQMPLSNLLKDDLQSENELKKFQNVKKRKVKKNNGRVEKKLIILNKSSKIHRDIILVRKPIPLLKESPKNDYILMRITEKQCVEEREQMAQDKTYLDSPYKCGDCLKGFMLRHSYDRHMEKHDLSKGVFVCTICKQRFESALKLRGHKRCHTLRYKCAECDLTRISNHAIKEHYSNKHLNVGCSKYKCSQCPKGFKFKVSLRKHVMSCHVLERVECTLCEKKFISKETLLRHQLRKHPSEGASDAYRRRHECLQCGLLFKAPSELAKHSVVHSERRAFYCVECDRSFKTNTALTRHLRTATLHVNLSELPLACSDCDKRFAIKRDLVRHTNRVHLNLKPYQCDKCDRAYTSKGTLTEHMKYTHEGVKRPFQYSCSLCNKVFDRSSILKSHKRTHTGERPYQCSRCPAQFAQSSGLGTHVKLVHLKLTRDGRPKALK